MICIALIALCAIQAAAAAAQTTFTLKPRIEPYRIVQPYSSQNTSIQLKFEDLSEKRSCIHYYQCPQSLRLEWSSKPYPHFSLDNCDRTRRPFRSMDTQIRLENRHVLSRYVKLNFTVQSDLLSLIDLRPYVTTYQNSVFDGPSDGRQMVFGIQYLNNGSLSCLKELPGAGVCGDLSSVTITMELEWKSNFELDANSFELTKSMLDRLDADFHYQALLSPERFQEATLYLLIDLPKVFVDEQWDLFKAQWLHQTFHEFMQYGRKVQIRVISINVGNELPEWRPIRETKDWIWISAASLVLVVIGCVMLLFQLKNRSSLDQLDGDFNSDDEHCSLLEK